MLYITLYLLYVFFLLFLTGSLTRKLLEKLTLFCHSEPSPDLVNTLILGIISLTTFVSFISLIVPVTQWTHSCILGFLLLYAFHDKKNLGNAIKAFILDVKTNPYLFILGCICLFPAILIASGQVGYHDTGMYHAQAVKWINEYGTVYGLGNLHYRLAFNSSWFYFAAFFDILFFDGRTAHVINLVPYTLVLLICFNGFHNLLKKNTSVSQILKCLLILPICAAPVLTIVFLPSLSPDFVVAVFILYALILAVDYCERREISDGDQTDDQSETYIVLFCLTVFLPTIKLSSLPVLLFAVFISVRAENRKIKLLLTNSLVGAIILLPFLLGNVLLSGYLLFPVPQIDLFSFDWKVPYQVAENVRKSIKYFAINPAAGDGIWSVAGMSTSEWIQLWFARSGGKLINYWTTTAFISAVVFFVVCFIRKIKLCLNLFVIQAIVLGGIVFWFFSAPAYRFGIGWIWAFIILAYGNCMYLVLQSVGQRFAEYVVRATFVVLTVALVNLLLIRWDSFALLSNDLSDLLFNVRPLPSETMKAVEIHQGLVINVPLKERGWNAELPGSPYVNHKLRLRGNTLGKGFRLAK
ncbi:MAG: hypothetical protein OES18_00790 [Deltaproteobacteria bacterium]|nr:hypothetical protein [Deltaproteobacteria bacterium]